MNWLAFVCIAVGAYNVGMLIYLAFDVDSLVTEQERGVYGSRSFADAICQAGIETQKNHQKQNRREGVSKGNEPAYPSSKTWNDDNGNWGIPYGLTKREYFAGLAMQARLGERERLGREFGFESLQDVALGAVMAADALLAELEKTA